MIPPSPALHPADVARAALRRLGELKLPPTPEFYAQHYYAILGGLPPAPPDPALDAPLPVGYVERVDVILDQAASVTRRLQDSVASSGTEVAASLEHLVADALPANVVELLQSMLATSNAMQQTLRASHAELGDARRSLAEIQTELSNNRKLLATDPLTGSDNRRALTEILEREIARALRDGHPLSIAMVDIDHFKKVNDTHGHAAGDAVLVHLTQVARSILRGNDAFVRYGGEEFVLVLSETASAGARYVATRLQQVLARQPCVYREHTIPTTFSAGVASLRSGDTEESLLRRADEAMYEAKRGGRNRVVATS
ncbi:MAG: GGDEF domain-containing protein [Burkholderiaceae bacterium]